MESDFHVQTAVQLLHDARRAKARTQRTETERVSDEAFGSAIAAHGKKFFVIQVMALRLLVLLPRVCANTVDDRS